MTHNLHYTHFKHNVDLQIWLLALTRLNLTFLSLLRNLQKFTRWVLSDYNHRCRVSILVLQRFITSVFLWAVQQPAEGGTYKMIQIWSGEARQHHTSHSHFSSTFFCRQKTKKKTRYIAARSPTMLLAFAIVALFFDTQTKLPKCLCVNSASP